MLHNQLKSKNANTSSVVQSSYAAIVSAIQSKNIPKVFLQKFQKAYLDLFKHSDPEKSTCEENYQAWNLIKQLGWSQYRAAIMRGGDSSEIKLNDELTLILALGENCHAAFHKGLSHLYQAVKQSMTETITPELRQKILDNYQECLFITKFNPQAKLIPPPELKFLSAWHHSMDPIGCWRFFSSMFRNLILSEITDPQQRESLRQCARLKLDYELIPTYLNTDHHQQEQLRILNKMLSTLRSINPTVYADGNSQYVFYSAADKPHMKDQLIASLSTNALLELDNVRKEFLVRLESLKNMGIGLPSSDNSSTRARITHHPLLPIPSGILYDIKENDINDLVFMMCAMLEFTKKHIEYCIALSRTAQNHMAFFPQNAANTKLATPVQDNNSAPLTVTFSSTAQSTHAAIVSAIQSTKTPKGAFLQHLQKAHSDLFELGNPEKSTCEENYRAWKFTEQLGWPQYHTTISHGENSEIKLDDELALILALGENCHAVFHKGLLHLYEAVKQSTTQAISTELRQQIFHAYQECLSIENFNPKAELLPPEELSVLANRNQLMGTTGCWGLVSLMLSKLILSTGITDHQQQASLRRCAHLKLDYELTSIYSNTSPYQQKQLQILDEMLSTLKSISPAVFEANDSQYIFHSSANKPDEIVSLRSLSLSPMIAVPTSETDNKRKLKFNIFIVEKKFSSTSAVYQCLGMTGASSLTATLLDARRACLSIKKWREKDLSWCHNVPIDTEGSIRPHDNPPDTEKNKTDNLIFRLRAMLEFTKKHIEYSMAPTSTLQNHTILPSQNATTARPVAQIRNSSSSSSSATNVADSTNNMGAETPSNEAQARPGYKR